MNIQNETTKLLPRRLLKLSGVCRWLLDLAALCLRNWRHAPSASPFHQLVISAKGAVSRASQHRLALHCVCWGSRLPSTTGSFFFGTFFSSNRFYFLNSTLLHLKHENSIYWESGLWSGEDTLLRWIISFFKGPTWEMCGKRIRRLLLFFEESDIPMAPIRAN